MKIVFVSDSLGTPIHPRGIFNYSVALVEILTAAGAEVDLVVEGHPHYSVEAQLHGMTETAPGAVNLARLSEIFRYFNDAIFSFRWSWGWRTRKMRVLTSVGRPAIAAWLNFRDRAKRHEKAHVDNEYEKIDFVPAKSEHLKLFRRFIVKAGFYSTSMSRANLDLPPPTIDLTGYDLVIVDTPHFIRITGAPRERIVAVMHDLIPLTDPSMDVLWRKLFIRKLEATLALGSNLAFVSKFTQRSFHEAMSKHRAPHEFVIHPAIRRTLTSGAAQASDNAGEPLVLPVDLEMSVERVKQKKKQKQNQKTEKVVAYALPPEDDALPCFVTATSDERRKNISTIVRAFYQHLRGRANIVILGDIDPSRYHPGADSNVYFTGYVSDARKIALFRRARGVVFASLSEGFGIPIVEGAVMGLPVICSDIAVFREVAGADAFYFDPRDPVSLAGAVQTVLGDPGMARTRAVALRASVLAQFSQESVGESVRAALATLGLQA